VLLLTSILLSWRAFAAWSASPELFHARDAGFVALAGALKTASAVDATYISPRGYDHPTLQYLKGGGPDLTGFDGQTCVRVPETGSARYIFLTAEDERGQKLIQSYVPGVRGQTLVTGPAGAPWAVEFTKASESDVRFEEMKEHNARFGDGFELLGYWVSDPAFTLGERVYVRLFWHATASPARDYTTFVHLLAPTDNGGKEAVGGADAQPGRGSCNTRGWQPGEFIVDELEFVMPADPPDGPYTLEVGMYDLATGERVAVEDGQNDAVLLDLSSGGP
jgi:hypothetical protein